MELYKGVHIYSEKGWWKAKGYRRPFPSKKAIKIEIDVLLQIGYTVKNNALKY